MKMSPDVYLAMGQTSSGHGSEDVRKVLGKVYAQVAGEPLPVMEKMPMGKPYFPQSPWHLSLTHTRTYAACGLGKTPLGLDAESMDRPVKVGLFERVLSCRERQWLMERGNRSEDFLTLWVLKEAYVKYTGQGIGCDLKKISFQVCGEKAFLEGSSLAFRLFFRQGHVLALCTQEEPQVHWLKIGET